MCSISTIYAPAISSLRQNQFPPKRNIDGGLHFGDLKALAGEIDWT